MRKANSEDTSVRWAGFVLGPPTNVCTGLYWTGCWVDPSNAYLHFRTIFYDITSFMASESLNFIKRLEQGMPTIYIINQNDEAVFAFYGRPPGAYQ